MIAKALTGLQIRVFDQDPQIKNLMGISRSKTPIGLVSCLNV